MAINNETEVLHRVRVKLYPNYLLSGPSGMFSTFFGTGPPPLQPAPASSRYTPVPLSPAPVSLPSLRFSFRIFPEGVCHPVGRRRIALQQPHEIEVLSARFGQGAAGIDMLHGSAQDDAAQYDLEFLTPVSLLFTPNSAF
jgi:hypothetical protein